MNKENLKEVINNLANTINMSDYELYKENFKDVTSIIDFFFENYLRKTEGFECCCDKSRFISKRLKKYIDTGINTTLQETYGEYQSRGGNIGSITELDEIAYWCPKTIKDTEEAFKIIWRYLCIDKKFFEERLKLKSGNNE